MALLFAVTLLLSAGLLFVVQPMFAKMALPLLGGSPMVWNTCMVFYQATLLAGYLYAHAATRRLGCRRQSAWHLGVLLLPWIVLPLGVAAGWEPPTADNPVPWLLALLSVSVGLPFLVVSTTAPLLQRWFAETDHPSAGDPYFLYAASNLGSLLALLAYPLLIEPRLSAGGQALAWTIGYAVLVVLVAGCAIQLWRSTAVTGRAEWRGAGGRSTVDVSARAAGSRREPKTDAAVMSPGRAAERLWWIVLSFAPSSLLLGVTAHISADIASVPLLWVVPLVLYLLTFVLVFARHRLLPHRLMLRVQPLMVVPAAALFYLAASHSVWVLLPLHLAVFFVTTMVCHGELVARRPEASRLTEFYIFMSLGGVLGGLFNAIVAPLVFHSVVEYPLMIAVACALRPRLDNAVVARKARRLDLLLPLGVFVLFATTSALMRGYEINLGSPGMVVFLSVAGLIVFGFQDRPVRFGLGVAALMLISLTYGQGQSRTLATERNFFGVVRVMHNPTLDAHVLVHGSTQHGMQFRNPARRREPLSYYHRTGPLGEVFSELSERSARLRIGVIGLGVGSIAAYGRPDDRMLFFEIDPAVERVARDRRWFTYLANARCPVEIVLGDGRLMLQRVPDGEFELLVLDAFSSDSIPVHLITREALRLYVRKLRPGGVLAIHATNTYLDLTPVLGNLAADADLVGAIQFDNDVNGPEHDGKFASCWAVMARRAKDLGTLLDRPTWRPLTADPRAPLWRDDFSDIISVLRWR